MWHLIYRLWSRLVSSRSFWQLMESTGICVLIGPNGSGKSLVMVESEASTLAGMRWFCFDLEHQHHQPFRDHEADCETCDLAGVLAFGALKADELQEIPCLCPVGLDLVSSNCSGQRLVYSTAPLTASKGVPHPFYRPLVDYRQLLAIEHADVLFDEVSGVADASGSASMPVQVTLWQHKLRKADIRQRVTTPAYARCALPVRQVAQVVVECRSFAPRRREGLLWRPRRIVLATAYDAWAFEDFVASDGQRAKLKPIARALIWVPDSKAITTYNTFGQVHQLGHVSEAGMCMTCGGTRSRPRCACSVEVDGLEPHLVEVVTEMTGAGTRVKRGVPVEQAPANGNAPTVNEGASNHMAIGRSWVSTKG